MDAPVEQPTEKPATEKPKRPTKPRPQKPAETDESYRSAIDPKDIDTEKEADAEAEVPNVKASPISDIPKITVVEWVDPAQSVETVPERILKIAEATNEEESDAKNEKEIAQVKKENAAENKEESEHLVEKIEKTV